MNRLLSALNVLSLAEAMKAQLNIPDRVRGEFRTTEHKLFARITTHESYRLNHSNKPKMAERRRKRAKPSDRKVRL